MAQHRVSKFGNQVNNHETKFICGPIIIVLPSANFDSTEAFQYARVNRRTRGGDLVVYRAGYWPKSKVFNLKFNDLSNSQKSSLIMFFRLTLGQLMTINNHEGRSFSGVITSPEAEAVESRGGRWSVDVVFETED